MQRKIKRFQRFKNISKKLGFLIFIACLFFVFASLITVNLRTNQQRKILKLENQALGEKISQLFLEKETLQLQVSQSGAFEYLERVAREDLNLQKQGEKVVAFPILNQQEWQSREERQNKQSLLKKTLNRLNI